MHRTAFFLALLVPFFSACNSGVGDETIEPPPPSPAAVDREAITEALAHADRPEADRVDDENRKPGDILELVDIAPGMRVLDLLAGGGYYT